MGLQLFLLQQEAEEDSFLLLYCSEVRRLMILYSCFSGISVSSGILKWNQVLCYNLKLDGF